jgi:trehalose-6-phosphate synthase
MPTRAEIESSEMHRESIDHQASETNGDYDLFDTVPLVALAVVIAYLALVFAFATLGG